MKTTAHLISLALLAVSFPAAAAESASRPNILFLVADDQHRDQYRDQCRDEGSDPAR